MLIESLIAFLAILAVSSVIYLLGRVKAPTASKSREKISMYACGERLRFRRLAVTVTMSKYLIYFVILDSSVLIIAFASLALKAMSLFLILIYLFTILTAVLLLTSGGD